MKTYLPAVLVLAGALAGWLTGGIAGHFATDDCSTREQVLHEGGVTKRIVTRTCE